MKKFFDGIVLLSDLDGTLLKHGELSGEHLSALRHFTQNGGIFCPATGRADDFVLGVFPSDVLNGYFVSRNGTTIYDPKEDRFVWSRTLDPSVKERALEIVHRYDTATCIVIHGDGEMLHFRCSDPNMETKLRALRRPMYKVVIHFAENGAARPAADYKDQTDFQYVRSAPFLFEILPPHTGKGVCTEELRKLLPPDMVIIGVGDYENDITLLKAVDIAVAVEGGYAPLKEYADFVAPPIDDHPISWLVEQLEKGGFYKYSD